jgi:hypothetical protein
MKKFVMGTLAIAALMFGSLSACSTDGTGGEGEGEGNNNNNEGEGEEGEGEEGEGEGGIAPGEPCTADAQCGTGKVCGNLFAAGPNQPQSSCFVSCTTAGEDCINNLGLPGACTALSATQTVCLTSSENLQLCGNAANGTCPQGVACAFSANDPATPGDESQIGICVIPCDANDTCVDAALTCSDGLQLTVTQGQPPVGVCAAPTEVGDTCGQAATGLTVCSIGQACSAVAANQPGTCQDNEPAGEGEGEGQ